VDVGLGNELRLNPLPGPHKTRAHERDGAKDRGRENGYPRIMTAADDAKTGASGGEPPRLSNNPNTENADDDLLLANAAAAHLLGATMRPDLVAKARALVEDEDDGDDAMGGGEDGDGDEMMFPLPAAKKVPGGITPMGVRADRGAGPLGGEGAATLAEMNGALSDLNTWHDRRRREEHWVRHGSGVMCLR